MRDKETLTRRPSAWVGLGAGCLLAALGLVLVLKALPYSSVHVVGVATSEATRRPTPDFAIGPLAWPVRDLSVAPELQPCREAFRSACADARGVSAAACAATTLAAKSPFGNPPSEYVDRDFDPVVHLERHLAGEPGHCLTRSAIVATELLAAGIPARVVQMAPAHAKGHTLVEVWDDTMGWTVVDPSAGGIVAGVGQRGSAADLLADPARVQWKPFGSAPLSAPESEAKKRYFQTLLGGALLYPEPWLYLRKGERLAPWPLRGRYARVGPALLTLGPAQRVLTWTIPALVVTGLVLVTAGWRRRHMHDRALRTSGAQHSDVKALGDLESSLRAETADAP
jgi:hypothetical protein